MNQFTKQNLSCRCKNQTYGYQRRKYGRDKLRDWNCHIHAAAAAAAKSLQLCLTLCNPIDGSPPSFSIPEILQARILEWVAIPFSTYTCYYI